MTRIRLMGDRRRQMTDILHEIRFEDRVAWGQTRVPAAKHARLGIAWAYVSEMLPDLQLS